MLEALKARLDEIVRVRDNLTGQLNATIGAQQEILRLIAELEAAAPAAPSRRGPKPGSRRIKAEVTSEFANDVMRPAEEVVE